MVCTGSLYDQVQESRNKKQDDPDVDMKLKAGRENESVGIEEVTPDFSNFF